VNFAAKARQSTTAGRKVVGTTKTLLGALLLID